MSANYERALQNEPRNGHSREPRRSRVPTDEDLANWNPTDGGILVPESRPEPLIRRKVGRLATARSPMKQPLLDPGFRRCEVVNLISSSKVGKSWLGYSLAFCLALGLVWLGRFVTTKCRVLLLDNELHDETIENRLFAVAEALGIRLTEDLPFEYIVLRGRAKRNLFELRSQLEDMAGEFDVVILDALYRMLPDDVSENDNCQITSIYNELDRLAATMQAAFVCIGHSSKGDQSGKRITDVGSGAGSASRAADAHLILREHEDDKALVLAGELRSFAPFDPIVLRWAYPIWVPDEDADPTKLKGRPGANSDRQLAKDAEADALILSSCQTWQSQTQLVNRTGMNKLRIARAILRLRNANLLEERSESHSGNDCHVYRKTIHAS